MAQRIQIYRQTQIPLKQHLATRLAGIDLPDSVDYHLDEFNDGYFASVFATDELV